MAQQTINTGATPNDGTADSPQTSFVKVNANFTELYAAAAGVANPTGTIGLTAVNGSLSTALRSDGAPALSQSIAPTWTGVHTFTNANPINISSAEPNQQFTATGGGTDGKLYDIDVTPTLFSIRTRTDANGTGANILTAARTASSTALGTITFGGDVTTVSGKGISATSGSVSGIRFQCTPVTGTPAVVGMSQSATNVLTLSTNTTQRAFFDANGNFATLKAVADQSKSVQVPTTGFTITIADNTSTLILNPAGTLATGTVTLPANPIDGQIIRIATSQIVTALTISANSGQTMADAFSTTLGAGSGKSYIYHLAGTVWFTLY